MTMEAKGPGSGDRGSAVARMAEAIRTRPLPRRTLTTLTIVLFLGGSGLLAYPFATNMFADVKQGRLERELFSDESRRAYIARTVPVGHALTRLRIPRLNVDTIVVEGITLSALRAGSGHYPRTPLPCERGNSAIAGHRTTYSKPFAGLHLMRPGDEIILQTPLGRCWYKVAREPWSTDPYDWSVVRQTRSAHLTLTTCDPPGSAARRLIVRAKLVRSEFKPPKPSAQRRPGGRRDSGELPGPK